MIGTEYILDEIDKLVQKGYEKGVNDGINQVFKEKYGDNFLSDEELATFNAYVDDCMDSIAFGNSDWVKIYKKITNGRMSEKSKKRIARYRKIYEYED